jgi:hypothetical protein
MEPISPELALIDPELAQRARALLPDFESGLDLPRERADVTTPSPAGRSWIRPETIGRVAVWLVIPSMALNIALLRTDSAAEPLPAPSASSSRTASAGTGRPARRPATAKPKPEGKRAGVESARHVRTARPRIAQRMLRWPASAKSKAYDVVVWRGHRRIADVWTAEPKVTVAAIACGGGRALAAGRYLWFVYPLVDARPRRFGRLAKWGEFAVGTGAGCASAKSR